MHMGAARSTAVDKHWAQLRRLVETLNATPLPEGENSDAEAAYYAAATPIIEDLIATKANNFEDIRVKAEAVRLVLREPHRFRA